MSNIKHTLRMNGYSADDAGIICDTGIERFKQERIGVLRIEISRDTKAARAVVDAIIGAIDEPRALTGRERRGGVVMLFRVEQLFNNLAVDAISRETIALRDGEELVISLASEGATVEVDAFTWTKGRSPLDISRDALPPLSQELADIANDAAWTAGARSPEMLARERESDRYNADLASGKIKVRTAEDQQARDDAELVASYEGVEVISTDGNAARLILDARYRHAARKQKAA
jgi:hypothetical protein